MPVESVAAYINNTFTFVMFILVCSILFLIIFLISSGLRKKILNRNPEVSDPGIQDRKADGTAGVKDYNGMDPFQKRNSIMLGIAFVLVFLSILLILASFYFSLNMSMGMSIFVISFILLLMVVVLVYIYKSKLFGK